MRTLPVCVLAPALLLLAASASAGPLHVVKTNDPLQEAVDATVDRTVEYVQDFDPSDNATVLREKTEGYVEDIIVILKDLTSDYCIDFSLGLDPNWAGTLPKLNQGVIGWSFPAYGFDEDQGAWGVGMLSVAVVLQGSCGSITLNSMPDVVDANVLELIKEEIPSTPTWYAPSPGFFCC